MKTRTKVILSIVSVLLAIAIILTSIFVPLAVSKKPVINSNEEVIRYIDASSLQNTTYEEKAKQLLSQFNNYNAKIDNSGNMSFEGTAEIDISQIQKLNFVTSYDKKIDKKIKVTVNQETCDFNIIISYYQENILLSRETIVTQPYYIEELDDYFVDVKGERISIKETLIADTVNNLAAGAAIGIAIGSLIVIAVYTLQPQMQQVITGVTEVVTRVFRSFWDWLRGLFTTQTVTRPVTTTVKVYRIEVNGQTYTLKKVVAITDDTFKESHKKQYRIAIRMNSDVLISEQFISKGVAIAILASNRIIALETNGKQIYQLNTYTIAKGDAEDIANKAAPALLMQGAFPHKAHCGDGTKTGVFFQHFHPGNIEPVANEKRTHSFFGTPIINS